MCTVALNAKDTVELTLHAQDIGANIVYLPNPLMEANGGPGMLEFWGHMCAIAVQASDWFAEASVAIADANPYRRSLLRQQRSVNTRRAIVRAAARLWTEKGYDETTVDEICAIAGIGRSTYYLHFTSKEELLVELSLATARGVAADVAADIGHGTLEGHLHAFVDGLVRRMESVPRTLAAAVMRRVSAARVPATTPPTDGPILFEHILADVARAAQERGEISRDVEASQLGEILSGMTLDALECWASGNTNRTLREQLTLRFELVLAGLTRENATRRTRRPS